MLHPSTLQSLFFVFKGLPLSNDPDWRCCVIKSHCVIHTYIPHLHPAQLFTVPNNITEQINCFFLFFIRKKVLIPLYLHSAILHLTSVPPLPLLYPSQLTLLNLVHVPLQQPPLCHHTYIGLSCFSFNPFIDVARPPRRPLSYYRPRSFDVPDPISGPITFRTVVSFTLPRVSF